MSSAAEVGIAEAFTWETSPPAAQHGQLAVDGGRGSAVLSARGLVLFYPFRSYGGGEYVAEGWLEVSSATLIP
jgi:hypothetical protein